MTYRFKTTSAKTYDKPKYEYPKLEDLQTETQYAFTLNPELQPSRQTTKSNDLMIGDWVEHVSLILDNLYHIKYHLQVELSSRFHFHGWIEIIDPILFYINDLPKLKEISTFAIKPCGPDNIWHTYVNKQRSIMEPYLLSKNITYEIGDYV